MPAVAYFGDSAVLKVLWTYQHFAIDTVVGVDWKPQRLMNSNDSLDLSHKIASWFNKNDYYHANVTNCLVIYSPNVMTSGTEGSLMEEHGMALKEMVKALTANGTVGNCSTLRVVLVGSEDVSSAYRRSLTSHLNEIYQLVADQSDHVIYLDSGPNSMKNSGTTNFSWLRKSVSKRVSLLWCEILTWILPQIK